LRGLASRFGRAGRRRGRGVLLRALGLPIAHLLVRAARFSARGAGVALVYHRIGDPAGDPRHELVPALGTELFASQVRHLVSTHRVVVGSELLTEACKRRRGERFPVAITFDDDLSSHLEAAAPILSSAGATATFFVSGASLHGPHRFWWERLQAALDDDLDLSELDLRPAPSKATIHEAGLRIQSLPPRARDELEARLAELVGPDPPESGLRAEALRRLAASRVEIGFHTRRHDVLPALGDAELADAMRAGRSELEDVVGPLRTISYPHGLADARVAAAARAAGFEAGFTGVPEAVTSASDPLLLGRLSPSYASVGELAFDVAWTLCRAAFTGKGPASPARRDRRTIPA
jgi:peptidoglycan/xylan/chitin deacetylase (PgdA/CDA1 family)